MGVADDDIDIDVEGVPMPAWLMSLPSDVLFVTWTADDGRELTVTFEQFSMLSQTIHCTWPRHASMISRPDPGKECRWYHPAWDEGAAKTHAEIHAVEWFTANP